MRLAPFSVPCTEGGPGQNASKAGPVAGLKLGGWTAAADWTAFGVVGRAAGLKLGGWAAAGDRAAFGRL
eukprot:5300500-Lingulodinium_polyedra.AAC.1